VRGDRWDADLLAGPGHGPPAAFVLGGASAQALGFVRSLGRRGILTVALGVRPGPWVWSRYCAFRAAADSEPELLDRLTRLGRRMTRRAVIVATGDSEVLFLSRNRDSLGAAYDFVLPRPSVVELLSDKRSQYRYAAGIGIPIPRTYYPDGPADVPGIARAVRFPCVVKPARSHAWRHQRPRVGLGRWAKAMQVENPGELRAVCERMHERGVSLLVQERVEGAESRLYSVYAYLDRSSEPLAACVIQKRRQWPPLYGSGSYSVSCRQERALELAWAILRPMGYQGVANVEFKQDPEDGELKLIEINPRCGERVALAVAAGVDIPYIAYRDALREPALPPPASATGVTWINALNDCAAVVSHYRRTERLGLWRWVRSALAAGSHAFHAWDDPMPCLENVVRVVGREAVPFGLHVLARAVGAPEARLPARPAEPAGTQTGR
jgi:predicted ATP-grasp superfamily ATP-dependent carboligase